MKWNEKLRQLIPLDEYKRVLNSDFCELEYDFLCFEEVYGTLSEIIPKDKTIIDLGCYAALQSYFFKDHQGYIGIDEVPMESSYPKPEHDRLWYARNGEELPDYYKDENLFVPRAACPNATYVVSKIQDYLTSRTEEEKKWLQQNGFAIMSYVDDREAWDLAKRYFPNIAGYYPSDYYGRNILRLGDFTCSFKPYDKTYMENLTAYLNLEALSQTKTQNHIRENISDKDKPLWEEYEFER